MEEEHGRRPYTWIWLGCLGLLVAVLAAVVLQPMLYREQHDARVTAALQIMRSIRQAEELHKTRMAAPQSYCSLDALRRDGSIPFGDGGTDPSSGYSFLITHGKDQYTITALPPTKDRPTFTMDEQGAITP